MAPVPGANWSLLVEQPIAEAFAPIYATLTRTAALLCGGAALAAILAVWLARRMTHPIRMLEEGTRRIGAGEFEYRIAIRSGDELEKLAVQFNQMANELAVSQERSERIARLKRFLAPQVAELVEKAGDDAVLAGQRAEVVVIFCDLRGFTALSSKAEPEQLMRVLGDYFEALGSVITSYEATVTSFSGDGLMALLNAPVPCADPAKRGVEMATAMQEVVQRLIAEWHTRGHEVGFGVGIAMGWATVGGIGYEGRLEYTAVGNVVNLAARLCAAAIDRQILIDTVAAEAMRGSEVPLIALGMRRIKGYDQPIQMYEAGTRAHRSSKSVAPEYRVERAAKS
jgi:class 3 adenylate cyclase